jgi:hypothetical protein
MERLEFDLLFRWFVGIGVDDVAWDHSVFSKNRERLLEGAIAAKLLSGVLAHPLCFMGHALMENRNGLVVDACLTPADGHAERVAALHMIEPHVRLGAERSAVDQRHHPFPPKFVQIEQYTCAPMSTWRIENEETETSQTTGDTKTCVVRAICYRHSSP